MISQRVICVLLSLPCIYAGKAFGADVILNEYNAVNGMDYFNGGTAFQDAMARLSVRDPNAATKIQNLVSGVDERNLKRGAFNYLAAANFEGDDRNRMLDLANLWKI